MTASETTVPETTGPEKAAPETPAPLLAVEDLVVDYRTSGGRSHRAVNGVSLSVHPGELVSVVGESGSGKTTLIQAALGLLPGAASIPAGTTRYSGVDVTHWSDSRRTRVRGSYVGFIPQDPNTSLNPTKTIGRQVMEAIHGDRAAKGDPKRRRETALLRLRAAGLPDVERIFGQYPHELSGGMKQRALVAIALAGEPKLIVADEPTSALDVTVQRVILDHLERLRHDLGIGILLVTHDLGVALDRSDRIVVMRDGRVVEEGGVDAVIGAPRDEYTRRLLAAAPGMHDTRLQPSAGVRPLQPAGGTGAAGERGDKLQARRLSKSYAARNRSGDRLHALADVDFTLRPGTVHAIVGESGAGKTTLAAVLAGIIPPDRGTVRLDGEDVTTASGGQRRQFYRDLQYVFQNPYTSLDPRWTVERIVAEPLRAFKTPATKAERQARVVELLDAVALDESFLRRLPSELSGGQRQRVAIARALALHPRVLVLDEAVSALDVSVQAQILQLLVDLRAELGLSYVFITHDLGVVRLIADDVTVMRGGRVVESGTAEQILRAPRHEYTRALLEAIPGRRHPR